MSAGGIKWKDRESNLLMPNWTKHLDALSPIPQWGDLPFHVCKILGSTIVGLCWVHSSLPKMLSLLFLTSSAKKDACKSADVTAKWPDNWSYLSHTPVLNSHIPMHLFWCRSQCFLRLAGSIWKVKEQWILRHAGDETEWVGSISPAFRHLHWTVHVCRTGIVG